MEFYELNRLYDENLVNLTISQSLDRYLYSFIPVIVSFGCGISLVNIIALSHAQSYFTSKHYLYAQSIFTFLFQIITSLILITNYYEKILLNYYFINSKQAYLNVKLTLNFIYNIVFYLIVWLFTIGVLDFAFISIIQFHLNTNFNKQYSRVFTDQLAHFNRIKKQLNNRLKRQLSVNSNYASSLHRNHSHKEERHKFNSITSFNSNLSRNITMEDNYSSDNHKLNPLILVNNYPDNEFNSYLDELNMFVFVKAKKSNDFEDTNVFCSSKNIRYSITTTVLVAVLLALPQLFAYEIKQSVIGVSPSKISEQYINSDSIKTYENIYFIKEELREDKPVFQAADYNMPKIENEIRLSDIAYSKQMSRAYGLALEIDKNQTIALNKLKTTYSNFFTLSGLFDLASKRYELCNSIRNNELYSPIRKPFNVYSLIASDLQQNQTWNDEDIEILNLTLICIREGSLNTQLTYNTLYFWLEHTMVISVPICIALVVLISIVYTCLHAKKLSIKQSKTKNKVTKLHKIFIETSNLNRMQQQLMQQQQQQQHQHKKQSIDIPKQVQETDILELEEPTQLSSSMKKKYRGAKFVQIKDDLNDSPNDDVFETNDDLNFCDLGESLEQQIDTESRVRQKQNEHLMLNIMFILDLVLFIVFSFPYTFMRLVLDLFVKDRIKINLDFYVLYKLTFLLFNFHLILKFFIMVIFNVKFRLCLCKVFAFKPSFCCIDDEQLIKENRSLNNKICCCCSKHQQFNKNNLDLVDDEDNILYHSTEFNSNLHQYNHPADPAVDQVFLK